jgi:hypothetical protein
MVASFHCLSSGPFCIVLLSVLRCQSLRPYFFQSRLLCVARCGFTFFTVGVTRSFFLPKAELHPGRKTMDQD